MSKESIERMKALVIQLKDIKWLVLEDDPNDRFLCMDVMRGYPITPIFAGTFQDAKTFLIARKFQLCLFDLKVPDVDDPIKCIDTLRTIQSDLPIIILTGGPVTPNLISLIEHRNIMVLRKPLTKENIQLLT